MSGLEIILYLKHGKTPKQPGSHVISALTTLVYIELKKNKKTKTVWFKTTKMKEIKAKY